MKSGNPTPKTIKKINYQGGEEQEEQRNMKIAYAELNGNQLRDH